MSTAPVFLPLASENADRRILGGFRFVDSITGRTILTPLLLSTFPLTIKPNASGTYAVFAAPGLATLTTDFAASQTWPPPQSFTLTVTDPAGLYLPRRFTLNLPAPPTPVTDASSVLNPRVITLFAGPAAVAGANWSVLRISAIRQNSTTGLPFALIRVLRTSDNAVLATALTDARGEALAAIGGLGVRASAEGAGAVLAVTTAATVQLYFDSTASQPPDPDALLANLTGPTVKTASQSVQLAANTTQNLPFQLLT